MKQKTGRRILSMPAWISRVRQQLEFNRLGREPPELVWKACGRSPHPRTEPGAIQIGHRLFVLGGYGTIDHVVASMDVFDLDRRRWTDHIALPADVPQTHAGITCAQDRFIYVVGGQLGPQCRPALADCFVFDTENQSWSKLPSLPGARYGPTTQIWNGRLHVISGAKPDRWTSACDHWSIAVAGTKAKEERWREEVPIPKGGPHRASAIVDDKLYVFGGQDGDVKPMAGDPDYACDWDTPLETLYGDSFVAQMGSERWENISAMLIPTTHAEVSVIIGHYVALVGGNQGRLRLSDLIQVYNSRADRWSVAGRLPYAMKTSAAYHDGWLYAVAGQRSVSRENLKPGNVLDTVWRAKFDPTLGQ